MQQWEYKIVLDLLSSDGGTDLTEEFEDNLNKLGKDGWEAVGFDRSHTGGLRNGIAVLLKRPLA